ncbi:hypothetical protein JKP88DRAFT_273753 [Tribonema minus]|uniref:Uncharacterized protein n=1 Tax=Tribonema minus TaxID=303371 RepID=A0A835YR35_9STRA|nr:hypothetical protein JKP88DRAFT_273753 [Tribonema minus]
MVLRLPQPSIDGNVGRRERRGTTDAHKSVDSDGSSSRHSDDDAIGEKEAGSRKKRKRTLALDPLLSELQLDKPFPVKGVQWWEDAQREFSAHLPHRVRDAAGEKALFNATGRHEWVYRRAHATEEGSHLYPLWGTSVRDLGAQFGLGIGLYFRQLQWLALAALTWGAINVATALYFTLDEYSDGQAGLADWRLTGSAACTRQATVTPEHCNGNSTNATASSTTSCPPETVYDCPFAAVQGVTDLAGAGAVVLLAVIFGALTHRQAARIDESVQTAQDYSITVHDPDADADDPQEWYRYFGRFGKVAYVTIARANAPLLALLAERRHLAWQLRSSGDCIRQKVVKAVAAGSARPRTRTEKQVARLLAMTQQIETLLAAPPTPVVRVYVTFELEASQRAALARLGIGAIPAAQDRSTAIATEDRFRGVNVLHVEESEEPSEVVWENLDMTLGRRLLQRALSTAVTAGKCMHDCVAAAAYFMLSALLSSKTQAGAVGVSLVSSALPAVLRAVVRLERHVNLTHRQNSLISKLLVARLLTSSGVILMGAQWAAWLSEDHLTKVISILISDALMTPAIRLVAASNTPLRRLTAARQHSAEGVRSVVTGSPWDLGERYTDAAKTFFLATFFAAVAPTGLFVGALALCASFAVDAYLLLRQWRAPPYTDAALAQRLRGGMLAAVLAHVALTACFYASWPFGAAARDAATGAWAPNVSAQPDWRFWRAAPQAWMAPAQRAFIRTYAVAGAAAVAADLAFHAAIYGRDAYAKLWYGARPSTLLAISGPRGSAQATPFSAAGRIEAFVPGYVGGAAAAALAYAAADLGGVHPAHLPRLLQHGSGGGGGGGGGGGAQSRNLAADVPPRYRRTHFGTITAPRHVKPRWRGGYAADAVAAAAARVVAAAGECEARGGALRRAVAEHCRSSSVDRARRRRSTTSHGGDGGRRGSGGSDVDGSEGGGRSGGALMRLRAFEAALRQAGVGVDVVEGGAGMEAVFRHLARLISGDTERIDGEAFVAYCVSRRQARQLATPSAHAIGHRNEFFGTHRVGELGRHGGSAATSFRDVHVEVDISDGEESVDGYGDALSLPPERVDSALRRRGRSGDSSTSRSRSSDGGGGSGGSSGNDSPRGTSYQSSAQHQCSCVYMAAEQRLAPVVDGEVGPCGIAQ